MSAKNDAKGSKEAGLLGEKGHFPDYKKRPQAHLTSEFPNQYNIRDDGQIKSCHSKTKKCSASSIETVVYGVEEVRLQTRRKEKKTIDTRSIT